MDTEILQKFCWADENHDNMRQPWSAGEYTFASNGHLLIRVPRIKEIPEIANPVDTTKVWPNTEPETWFEIPKCEAPPPADCPKCKGQVGKPTTCPECDGDGEVEFSTTYNDYTVDCATCNGSGKEPVCSNCEGTGKVEVFKALPVGCAGFQTKYLALLGALPGCQIGTIDEIGPAWFRFVGGTGLIMPARRNTWDRAESL